MGEERLGISPPQRWRKVFAAQWNKLKCLQATGSEKDENEPVCVCVWTLNKIYTLVINTVLCYALLLGHVQLSVTPWTAAGQAPLSMGILQARILEWVAMSSSRGSYWPRNWTRVSCIAGGFFTSSATREALTILYHLLISIFFKQHSISLYIENWIRSFKAHSKKCF